MHRGLTESFSGEFYMFAKMVKSSKKSKGEIKLFSSAGFLCPVHCLSVCPEDAGRGDTRIHWDSGNT